MMSQAVDRVRAREAAVNFLQRYHNVVRVERIVLVDGVWQVDVLVSSPTKRKLQVEIDSHTGNILCF
ncbi:MAG TPA: hypothetical protein VJ792_08485 [Candidatus Nitrosotalea sp.]|nr:hypothetical protein [Candidatus Nitrosotalea sp.]